MRAIGEDSKTQSLSKRVDDMQQEIETLRQSVDFLQAQIVPIGGIIEFIGKPEDVPDGWQLCNGDSVQVQSKLSGRLPDAKVPYINKKYYPADNKGQNINNPPNIGVVLIVRIK